MEMRSVALLNISTKNTCSKKATWIKQILLYWDWLYNQVNMARQTSKILTVDALTVMYSF